MSDDVKNNGLYEGKLFDTRFIIRDDIVKNVMEYFNSPFVYENGNVICLDGLWGSGKTHLITSENGLKNELEKCKIDEKNLKVIYINAWYYQKYRHPALAFANLTDNDVKLSVSLNIPFVSIGINDNKTISGNIYENFVLTNEMQNSIDEISSEEHCVYIIDELDRCNPEYALDFIEFIQHFSYMKTVLVSANLSAMKGMLSQKYGKHYFDYFDKIFSKVFHLPSLENEKQFITRMIQNKLGFKNNEWEYYISLILKYFIDNNLTTRQLERLLNNNDFCDMYFISTGGLSSYYSEESYQFIRVGLLIINLFPQPININLIDNLILENENIKIENSLNEYSIYDIYSTLINYAKRNSITIHSSFDINNPSELSSHMKTIIQKKENNEKN